MMKKRTVLITGGAKRVGKEIALSLANKDTNLIIHYNKSVIEAKKLKLLLEERGSKCALIKSNLSNQKDLKKIINNAKKFYGTINCLINNASLFLNDNVENFSDKLWNDHLNINLLAPIRLSQEFNKQLPKKSQGHIINILDQNIFNPDTSFFSYNISKSALYTATIILAKSFAPNVRVNAIGPGPTIKNIHQSKKHFEKSVKSTLLKIGSPPSEIVKSVIFLLESKAITGQFITVDGGEHLK
jgi:NAD(P)-dependent dehydrogenase (short-subunit alcohol dehydrogenase family)